MLALVAAQAGAFGGAAWAGSYLGPRLVAGHVPFHDGPRPVRLVRWPFALIGAAVGAASAHDLPWPHAVVLAVVIGLLAACAAADLRSGLIPDACSLGALGLVLATSAFERTWAPLVNAALVAAAFGIAALVSRGRGMGWGDVKLAAVGGALLGVFDATLAFALGSLVAYVVVRRAGTLRTPIAFGPYLAAATAIALAFQRPL